MINGTLFRQYNEDSLFPKRISFTLNRDDPSTVYQKEDLAKVVIAYEPVWAIGTGKTATSEDANDVISYIRQVVANIYGDLANDVRIQYGGSVKPSNVAEIMNQSDIDGALVGGASLKANDYVELVNF